MHCCFLQGSINSGCAENIFTILLTMTAKIVGKQTPVKKDDSVVKSDYSGFKSQISAAPKSSDPRKAAEAQEALDLYESFGRFNKTKGHINQALEAEWEEDWAMDQFFHQVPEQAGCQHQGGEYWLWNLAQLTVYYV